MATVTTNVGTTAYVQLTTTNALIQNTSDWPVRIHFGTNSPAANTVHYHVLPPNEFLKKEGGLPAGNVYAISVHYDANVAVSE